jgi:hypothetical protein
MMDLGNGDGKPVVLVLRRSREFEEGVNRVQDNGQVSLNI